MGTPSFSLDSTHLMAPRGPRQKPASLASVAQLSHSGLVVDPHPLGSVWVRPGLSPPGGWRGRAWGARASLHLATRVRLERASGCHVHDEACTRPADSACTGNTDGSPVSWVPRPHHCSAGPASAGAFEAPLWGLVLGAEGWRTTRG